MSQSELSPDIRMQVEGEVSGQVAAGLYNVQIGSVHGGVVNINPQGQPTLQPKSRPVSALPRRIGWYVNREQELSTATRSLEEFEPVEFRGPAGMGKTVLLRRLTHQTMDFPDGVVYSRINDRPAADVLQELFDRFYEASDPNYKPRHGQLLDALQSLEALIVLDDVEEGREEMDDLLNAMPGCTFLLASTQQRLWGEGREVVLKGLSAEDALELVERELGRELEEEESEQAKELATALDGNPQSILQAAAKIRDEGISIAEIGRKLGESAGALTAELLETLSEGQQNVLAMLTSLEGTPLHAEHIDALLDGEDVEAILEELLARRLIQAHSPEYSIAANLANPLRDALDVAPWPEAIAGRLIDWGQGQRDNPGLILRDAAAFLKLLTASSREGRWQEALDLALIVEGPLAIGRRWQAWASTLESALKAARELGSGPAEALALHQMGSRALLLGDNDAAREYLNEALRIREGSGDEIGAAITRHNLSLLPSKKLRSVIFAMSPLKAAALSVLVIIILACGIFTIVNGGLASTEAFPTVTKTEENIAVPSKEATAPQTVAPATPVETPTLAATVPQPTPTKTATRTATPSRTPSPSPSPSQTSTPTRTPGVSPLAFTYDISWRISPVDPLRAIATVTIDVTGGLGPYRYFYNIDQVAGPVFEYQWTVCQGNPGTLRVESADGQVVSMSYFENPPCPTPTASATPTPTATATATPSPTPWLYDY
jgi:hypothetical protein